MISADEDYLIKFENRDLRPESFDHRGHLYMAWLHLSHYGPEEAVARVCNGIRELAAKFGAPEKYNRTLTEALMRIIHGRMQQRKHDSFNAFLDDNPDLVCDAEGLLYRHYSRDRLQSTAARTAWVAPDRRPIG